MTVTSATARKSFTGDGATTSFGTSPIVFFDDADLDVYAVTTATGASTLLTLDTHYTVSGGDGSTGTVDLTGGSSAYGAPASTQTLVIVRDVAITQSSDFINNDTSDAEVVEDALDRLTMIAQQNAAAIDRSFTLADSDVSGASTVLPTPAASKLIGWDSAGTALTNYASASIVDTIVPTAFMETLLDDASAAVARTTLDAQQDVFTTRGDLVRAGASGVAERFALGAPGARVQSNGTDAVWDTPYAVVTAHATTMDPWPNRVSLLTGSAVTFTDIADADYVGQRVLLLMNAAHVWTNNVALDVQGGANYTCAVGDIVEIVASTVSTFYVTIFPNLGVPVSMQPITNSLSGDVALSNTGTYFTGPTVAQGTAGTWFASGTVTLTDTAGAADFRAKLWDGTTVIASGQASTAGANGEITIALSGYLAAPAGNIRISAIDVTSASGAIVFNGSGNSKDSTVSAIRIA